MWRPLGNLPDWEIEYDQMRSRMQARFLFSGCHYNKNVKL